MFSEMFYNQKVDFAHCSAIDKFALAQQQQCSDGEKFCWMSCLPLNPDCVDDPDHQVLLPIPYVIEHMI